MAVRRSSTKRVTRRRAVAKKARVPRAPKKAATRRATRRAARRASVPKAPKRRRSTRRSSKRVSRRRAARKARIIVGSMRRVFKGTAGKTKGGLVKKDLMMNKRGKVVSKKQHAKASKGFKKSALHKWVVATQRARKELGLTGFVACKKGTAYYKLSKKYFQ